LKTEHARQQQEDNAAAQQQVQSEQEQRNAAERQRQVRERDADGPPTTRFPENPNDVAERWRRELDAATQIAATKSCSLAVEAVAVAAAAAVPPAWSRGPRQRAKVFKTKHYCYENELRKAICR
jgi:hypothetical protein